MIEKDLHPMQMILTVLAPARGSFPLLLILSILSSPTLAEDVNESAQGSVQGHEIHHFHKHELGVFAGITHGGRRKNEPAIGVEYERRINESFGIGALAEYTFGDADFLVVAVPFLFHINSWKLLVAPGVEHSSDHGNEALVRFGAGYGFKTGGWMITPQVNVDFVDGEDVWVFGVGFGKGF
jgi:hypothetical protein